MASVCLVLTETTLADNLALIESQRPWIGMAELRADFLPPSEWPQLNQFSKQADLPLILTLRQPADGGHWRGSPADREAFFAQALEGDWAYWDLEPGQELPELESAWLAKGRKIVRSFHDFKAVPDDLVERVQALVGPGIIPKAAVYPQNTADYLKFLQFNARLSGLGQKVLLAMGPYGQTSRILAAHLKSEWTYASVPGKEAAPGHLDPQTLSELYRFSKLTESTAVYGILGHPVYHSKSPLIHNTGLSRLGLDGVYVPFLADDAKAALLVADLLGVTGLSVTIPHKETVLKLAGELSAAVQAIGACNTLSRKSSGTPWTGDNTDAPGFLSAVTELWGRDLSAKSAVVIGNGGAARGVVWALRQAGARVLILGRSLQKAQVLAEEFGAQAAVLDASSLPQILRHNDLIAQTTNVGMGDLAGQDPLDFYPWTGKELAYEIIYAPARTAFVSAAEQAGCRVIYGKAMLIGQALLQFRQFTGAAYPLPVPEF